MATTATTSPQSSACPARAFASRDGSPRPRARGLTSNAVPPHAMASPAIAAAPLPSGFRSGLRCSSIQLRRIPHGRLFAQSRSGQWLTWLLARLLRRRADLRASRGREGEANVPRPHPIIGSYWPSARIFAALVQAWTTVKYRATPFVPTSNGFGAPGFRLAAVWALKYASSNSE